MSGHIYVAASGFGVRVIPKAAPYRFRIDSESGWLLVDAEAPDGWLSGSCNPVTGNCDEAMTDVAEVVAGPNWKEWWLETGPYRVPLPVGWTSHSSGSLDPVPFDLVSGSGAMIYVQTPSSLARASDLVGPGQQLERTWDDAEGEWLDVSYAHDGSTWFQRHCLRRWNKLTAVITGQSERHALEETMACHAQVVRTITPQLS